MNSKIKCPLCEYKCRPDNLKPHIQNKHNKMFEYFCECGTKFTTTTARDRHKKYNCKGISKPITETESHPGTKRYNATRSLPTTDAHNSMEPQIDIQLDEIREANISLKMKDGRLFAIPLTISKIPHILSISSDLPLTPASSPVENSTFDYNDHILDPNFACKSNEIIVYY